MARRTLQSPSRAEITEAERGLAARFDDDCLPNGTMGTGRAAARSMVRRWRCTGYAWFWGDARDDFGSVLSRAGVYVATTVRGSAEFEVLGDAKTFVEEHSS